MVKVMKQNKEDGFTLIEVVIVVAILGILSSAFVSMGSMTRDFRIEYAKERLYNSIILARSEAISRKENITVCRSILGTNCDSGYNWVTGWIVFVDGDANKKLDDGDKLIRVYNNMSSAFNVIWSGSEGGFFFNSRGQVDFDENSTFSLCLDDIENGARREILVYSKANRGRIGLSSDYGDCNNSADGPDGPDAPDVPVPDAPDVPVPDAPDVPVPETPINWFDIM